MALYFDDVVVFDRGVVKPPSGLPQKVALLARLRTKISSRGPMSRCVGLYQALANAFEGVEVIQEHADPGVVDIARERDIELTPQAGCACPHMSATVWQRQGRRRKIEVIHRGVRDVSLLPPSAIGEHLRCRDQGDRMVKSADEEEYPWMARWLGGVREGGSTMSQRLRSSVDENGGIDNAIDGARRRGVHLAQITDDRGQQIVVASVHPFRTLC